MFDPARGIGHAGVLDLALTRGLSAHLGSSGQRMSAAPQVIIQQHSIHPTVQFSVLCFILGHILQCGKRKEKKRHIKHHVITIIIPEEPHEHKTLRTTDITSSNNWSLTLRTRYHCPHFSTCRAQGQQVGNVIMTVPCFSLVTTHLVHMDR